MQEFIRRIARQLSEVPQRVTKTNPEITPSTPEELSLDTLDQVSGGTDPVPAVDGPHSSW